MTDPLIQKKQQLFDEMREAELTLAAQQDIVNIVNMPAWKSLIGKMADIENTELGRLRVGRLDEYTLGRVQGYLQGLRLLINLRPLDSEDVDRLTGELKQAREQYLELDGGLKHG